MRDTTTPPITAEMMPLIGGKPEAMAMPRHSGKAMRKTRKPEARSARQFSINPGRPVLGMAGVDAVAVMAAWLEWKNQSSIISEVRAKPLRIKYVIVIYILNIRHEAC
jgi:hypothetical protein